MAININTYKSAQDGLSTASQYTGSLLHINGSADGSNYATSRAEWLEVVQALKALTANCLWPSNNHKDYEQTDDNYHCRCDCPI